MSVVIRCLSMANGSRGPNGQFLSDYNPATGESEWTNDPEQALTFATMAEAQAFWLQVHPTEPVRSWDGRPNRPLTAFTVEIGEPSSL